MTDEITKVDPMDEAKNNSQAVDSLSGETTIILGEEKSKCFWNDAEFNEGDKICDQGVAYECHMGIWVKRDEAC